jgi:hypothetical protein
LARKIKNRIRVLRHLIGVFQHINYLFRIIISKIIIVILTFKNRINKKVFKMLTELRSLLTKPVIKQMTQNIYREKLNRLNKIFKCRLKRLSIL